MYCTNSYNKPRGRSQSTPPAPTRPHPAAPTLGTPGCPDVRVHPAAPTFRVHPAAPTLGYTRLPPRPVKVRSWGGWVRNGIKITISKMRLYKFICATYSGIQYRKTYNFTHGTYHSRPHVILNIFSTRKKSCLIQRSASRRGVSSPNLREICKFSRKLPADEYFHEPSEPS